MLLTLALLALAPAGAQEMPMKAPNCPADAQSLPPELAPWTNPAPLAVATSPAGIGTSRLVPGAAADLALVATPAVSFVLRPEHPGGSVAHGGMAGFQIAAAGTYRVAIGSGAWIDVVQDGKSLVSAGHGRGPACSGIGKMVDFALQPGDYVLQISGNGGEHLPVLIARIPG